MREYLMTLLNSNFEEWRIANPQADINEFKFSAEKMSVSRSAIAKWETDKGLPDINNLKALAQFLNVSVDYLLDDGERICELVTKEAYDLANYGKGIKKRKKDRVIQEKFPDAEIYTLLGRMKLR